MPPVSGFYSIMVAFGNSCNLACRTCGSYSSTTWIKEEKKLEQRGETVTIFPHHRFYHEREFLEQLKEISSDARHIYFPGGESLLAGVDEHLEYLDYLIDIGSSDTNLHYVTNATIFPGKKFWNRWSKFKKVDIQLSIDGLGKHFEYSRWPAIWDDVEANIRRYQDRQKSFPNIKISIGHVISVFTVYYFPEFYKWCLQNNLKDPFISLLSIPTHYDIRSLPLNVKEKIKEKLERYHFNNIINYMYQGDLSTHYESCQKYINMLDQDRNQSFKETFPEFYQILKEVE
jgi:MoaA/NifB/PqqE/SkfB family radical SAM enzyme